MHYNIVKVLRSFVAKMSISLCENLLIWRSCNSISVDHQFELAKDSPSTNFDLNSFGNFLIVGGVFDWQREASYFWRMEFLSKI